MSAKLTDTDRRRLDAIARDLEWLREIATIGNSAKWSNYDGNVRSTIMVAEQMRDQA